MTGTGAEFADHVGFGRYLRQQRELRAISVEEVARATKISPTLVVALEAGQAERLPEHVFVLNYIRSYALAVGLSPEDALNRYQQIPQVPRPPEFDPAALEQIRRDRAISALWVIAAGVALVFVAGAVSTLYELAQKLTSR